MDKTISLPEVDLLIYNREVTDAYSCEIPECSAKAEAPGGEVLETCDYCIVPELKKLWEHGIRTLCSCCGHGNETRASIRVDAASAKKMDALGYERYEPHKCIFHPGSVSFRSMDIGEEMAKGGPEANGDINEIRERWKRAARIGGKAYV